VSSFTLPAGWRTAAAPEDADVQIAIGLEHPVASWIYALVAPFPTIADGIAVMDLHKAWSGQDGTPLAGRPLWMEQNTLDVFTALWGIPAPGATRVLSAEQLADASWSDRPAWAIVPFEAIEPRWKVLEVDGISPLRREFDPAAYALAVPVSCRGSEDLCRQAFGASLPFSNRDPSKLTTLVLTGTTALVRATAVRMESQGVLYPAQDIGALLQSADLTHVSNEIPFFMYCPPPDPDPGNMRFCSDPRYIDLLEYIGADIVELTGNHILDYGTDSMLFTLELYRQRGWRYYGGGENLDEARAPITLEHNGNRLAFIGCNKPGFSKEWATDSTPGAAPCDFEYLRREILRLRLENYLPIMTFQYTEFYQYRPTPEQVQDFHTIASAGPVIVSGSQAHFPQTFEFSGSTFIHYGLGNLFFDQYGLQPETETAFIDRHVFYGGRYLGAEIITIRFVDSARPRFMTPEERAAFLATVFAASGW
jgi:poly-gamma-glutamate synthesis protein (capsule biosynthesis protein)